MAVAQYWLARTAMFLAVYVVLWRLGWFDVFAVLIAFVIAWLVSYIAFPTLRRKAATQMDGWIAKGQRGIESDAVEEDAERDELTAPEASLEGDSEGKK